jgi:hypothetical protein
MWFIIIGVICILTAIAGAYSIRRSRKALRDQIDQLQGMYDPSRGGLSSKVSGWQSEKRAELADRLTTEAQSATILGTAQIGVMNAEYDVERTPERIEVRRQIEEATDATQVETAQFTQEQNLGRLQEGRIIEAATAERNLGMIANEKQVIDKATKEGHHAATYLKTEEKRQLDKLDLDYKAKESEINVTEHRQRRQIDVDMDLQEKLNTLDAILKYKNMRFAEFDELRGRILGLIDEEHKISASHASAEVKGEQLAIIQHSKQTYLELFNAQKTRLLETGDREVISGLNAITDFIGSDESSDSRARE